MTTFTPFLRKAGESSLPIQSMRHFLAVLLLKREVPAVRFFKFVWYFREIGKPNFAREMAEKRLDLKSLKRQTNAEELGDLVPELLSLRVSLKAL